MRIFRFLDTLEALDSSETARRLPQVQSIQGYSGFYRARVGRYRIGFEIRAETGQGIMHSVGAHGDFYHSFPPR